MKTILKAIELEGDLPREERLPGTRLGVAMRVTFLVLSILRLLLYLDISNQLDRVTDEMHAITAELRVATRGAPTHYTEAR